jgi:hypothetical protein
MDAQGSPATVDVLSTIDVGDDAADAASAKMMLPSGSAAQGVASASTFGTSGTSTFGTGGGLGMGNLEL